MSGVAVACPRCESQLEEGDLRCQVCLCAAPVSVAGRISKVRVEILRCSGCGAAVSYDVSSRAPRCVFCGSRTRVEAPEDPREQTQSHLPFTVDRAAAERAFRSWLGGLGWFRPSNLRDASTIQTLRPLWWVGWVCSASALVSWTADSDADSRRAKWAPHAGQTEIGLDRFVVSASRGLAPVETDALAASYDLETATDRLEATGGGVITERFDVLRSAARRHVRTMIAGRVRQRLLNGIIPGRRFRNVRTEVLLRRLVTRRCAFPSHVLAYRYRRRVYRLVISGQDAGCLLGSAPYSVAKIVLTVAVGAVGLAALIAAVVAALLP